MNKPANHHFAELNLGVLRQEWDDPRTAEFANGIAPGWKHLKDATLWQTHGCAHAAE